MPVGFFTFVDFDKVIDLHLFIILVPLVGPAAAGPVVVGGTVYLDDEFEDLFFC